MVTGLSLSLPMQGFPARSALLGPLPCTPFHRGYTSEPPWEEELRPGWHSLEAEAASEPRHLWETCLSCAAAKADPFPGTLHLL